MLPPGLTASARGVSPKRLTTASGVPPSAAPRLLASNTLVAVTSATGFIGAQRLRTLYVTVGAVAGVSSLVIGLFFIAGLGTALPDLQELLFGHRG